MPSFFELAENYFDIEFVPDEELDDTDITFPTFTVGIARMLRKITKG